MRSTKVDINCCHICGQPIGITDRKCCNRCLDKAKARYYQHKAQHICPKCLQPSNTNGVYCSSCRNTMAEQKLTLRTKNNQQAYDGREKRRELVLTHYGRKCVMCGITDSRVLCLDHVNGDGNEHRKELGSNGTSIIKWCIENNFPDRLQLLCRNCHWIKHKCNFHHK